MSDWEILEKYIDLSNICLQEEEKEEVMDMLYKYKEAFSLRDEIGTCLRSRNQCNRYITIFIRPISY